MGLCGASCSRVCPHFVPLTPPPPQSTDGHSGNWSFSLSRLNWHVAELAVGRGGAVVVDATRSPTKRFPDALAKTLPIWAAVLNAAAARLQGCAPPRSWLPPWVAPSEASEIDARTPAWATALLALLPGLRGLAPSLAARPLRCVWVSQGADVWAPGCAPGALPFTPLVALSASQPLAGPGRRAAGFVYVPGAGDDEESWAGGLSPGAFWAQRRLARGERPSHAPGPAASPASAPRASPGACLPPAGVGALGVAASAPRLRSAPLAVAPLGTSGLGGCGGDDGALLAAASFAALRGGAWPHAVVLLEAVVGEARLEQPLTPSAAGAAAAAAAAPRTLALLVPPRGTKRSPQPLAEALPGLLLFARAALGATPPVPLVVACADGCTVAPAALAALLAACFREAPGGGGTGAGLRFVGDAGPVTKDGLRRALALLSAHHPDARPSRNLIKQVFAGLGGGAGWRDGEARGV